MLRVREKDHIFLLALALLFGVSFMAACAADLQHTSAGNSMTEIVRLSPQEVHQRVSSGKALLVCAYQDEAMCRDIMLEGAISLKDFASKIKGLSKDQEVIFYCS